MWLRGASSRAAGIPARRGHLHVAAASGLERRRADQPRGQARRRRLARRRQRRGQGRAGAGNMFVPIDALPPILADLLAEGRAQGPSRPWLGITAEDVGGLLLVTRVAAEGPPRRPASNAATSSSASPARPPRRWLISTARSGPRGRRHPRAARRGRTMRRGVSMCTRSTAWTISS